MNFREFCSEYQYSHFIGLTYNFDPVYFEKVILKDLIQHGINNNIIFCDNNSLLKTLEQTGAEAKALGKQYILNNVHIADGAFHPKVYLLLGQNGFKLGISSGNLTFGGTGANNEVISVWESNNLQDASLSYLFDYMDSLTINEIAKDYMQEVRNRYLIEQSINYDILSSNFLLRPFDDTLANLLEKRWKGRQFESLVVLTGSTDEKGVFIEWCSTHFGIKKCTIVGNYENISLLPKHLNKIPIDVIIAPLIGTRLMHGKVYLFKKNNKYSVISGSANCSAAAWLTPLGKNGNIECVTIFEGLNEKSVKHFLELIPEESYTAKEWKPIKRDSNDKRNDKKLFVIEHLIINYELEVLELKLIKPELYKGEIYLIVDEEKFLFNLSSKDNVWICSYIASDVKSNLIKLQFIDDDNTQVISYWIDDPEKIKNFSFHYKLRSAFTNLKTTNSFKDVKNLINDLLSIQSLIFDSSNYSNEKFSLIDSSKVDEIDPLAHDKIVMSIKPEMIIKSITESPLNSGFEKRLNVGHNTFSLLGILRFLFDDFHEEKEEIHEIIDDYELDDVENFNDEIDVNNTSKENEKAELNSVLTYEEKEKLYEKFRKFIENFIYEISCKDFFERCTARQFSDTIAFSLLIILKLLNRSDFLKPLSQFFLSELLNTLFFKEVNGKIDLGIYKQVYSKYKLESKETLFVREVGSGYLWVSLILAMLSQKIEKPSTALLNSIFLKYIYTNELLLKHLKTSNLIFPFISESKTQQFKRLFEQLPSLITKFEILEQSIENSYEDLKEKEVATDYKEGQIIFNGTFRWGKIKEINGNSMEVFVLYIGQIKKINIGGFWISPLALLEGKGKVQDNYNNLLGLLNSIQKEFEVKDEIN